MATVKTVDVAVIGSGPSGLTAAIYTARANLSTVVFEGPQPGGQLTITAEVENFPGFPEGIMGPELMDRMRKQALKYDTEIIPELVKDVDFSGKPLKLVTDKLEVHAKAVIACTGASARSLGLESEARLMGHGVSACATCDGFFYRDKEIIVVGGGDAACEEAIFLTKFASKVNLVHRRDELRASKILRDRVKNHPKIDMLWDTVIDEVVGDQVVTGVKLKNVKSGEVTERPMDGVFIAIGHTPNTKVLQGKIDLTDTGYIAVTDYVKTSSAGVFAAGDAVDYRYQQAVTAAGTGCMAALEVEKYIDCMEQGEC